MDWSVQRGSGSLLVFTNRTGGRAVDVEMRLKGKAVGGRFAQHNWSVARDEMADGQAIEAPFRAAWGANTDPSRMEITWTSSTGQRRQVVLDDLPLSNV